MLKLLFRLYQLIYLLPRKHMKSINEYLCRLHKVPDFVFPPWTPEIEIERFVAWATSPDRRTERQHKLIEEKKC